MDSAINHDPFSPDTSDHEAAVAARLRRGGATAEEIAGMLEHGIGDMAAAAKRFAGMADGEIHALVNEVFGKRPIPAAGTSAEPAAIGASAPDTAAETAAAPAAAEEPVSAPPAASKAAKKAAEAAPAEDPAADGVTN